MTKDNTMRKGKTKVPKALVAQPLDVLSSELSESATNVLELDLKEITEMISISDKEALRIFTQLKKLFATQVGGVQGAKSTLVAIKDGLGMKTEISSEFDTLQRLAIRLQLFDLLVVPRLLGTHKGELEAVGKRQLLLDGLSKLPPILGSALTIEHDNLAAVQKPSDRSRAKVYRRGTEDQKTVGQKQIGQISTTVRKKETKTYIPGPASQATKAKTKTGKGKK